MGTLSSELAPHAERLSPQPRIYADANVPAGLVAHMRGRLGWDVLFVLEEKELRRASDLKHYRLARQLRRTLVTLDRDYLDDRRFPPAEGRWRARAERTQRARVLRAARAHGPGAVQERIRGWRRPNAAAARWAQASRAHGLGTIARCVGSRLGRSLALGRRCVPSPRRGSSAGCLRILPCGGGTRRVRMHRAAQA